jgi:hypothetical protein
MPLKIGLYKIGIILGSFKGTRQLAKRRVLVGMQEVQLIKFASSNPGISNFKQVVIYFLV